DFEEVHKNILVVATNQRLAIQKSIQAQTSWTLPHKDALLELEKAFSVSESMRSRGLHIHLTKAAAVAPLVFNAKYTRLGLKAK
ncbi:hypothetical protein ABTC19_19045, partial [Acinetobacter baumannii]